MKFLSDLKQKDLFGKVCLLRIDLNIKDNELKSGDCRNNLRVQAILPTIKFLVKNGAKAVLLSHRGRPRLSDKRQTTNDKKKLSLKPFAGIFEKLLKEKVEFINLNTGTSDVRSAKNLIFGTSEVNKSGKIFLLENLRFDKGEEGNGKKFARKLAKLGNLYVNDAFAVSHRRNASVCAITKFLPSYAGLLLEKEIKNLDNVLRSVQDDSRRVFVVILGGAKISDKIGLIKNFINKADYFLIGGGIANTFLKAQGLPVGDSLYEKDKIDFANNFLKNTHSTSSGQEKLILPVDYLVLNKQICDIGPRTEKLYSDIIKKAHKIIWNGPMGIIEKKESRKGSEAVVVAVMKSKAFAVVGGGETSSLFNNKRTAAENQRIFISTGGGAMLKYLAGEKLPGIMALK